MASDVLSDGITPMITLREAIQAANSNTVVCDALAGSATDVAARLGWTVASMRDDWATVFATTEHPLGR